MTIYIYKMSHIILKLLKLQQNNFSKLIFVDFHQQIWLVWKPQTFVNSYVFACHVNFHIFMACHLHRQNRLNIHILVICDKTFTQCMCQKKCGNIFQDDENESVTTLAEVATQRRDVHYRLQISISWIYIWPPSPIPNVLSPYTS